MSREKGNRILIVDDEDAIRGVLHQKISGGGYWCEEAGSATQDLEKLYNNPIEGVLGY